jgi:hypothetical protein
MAEFFEELGQTQVIEERKPFFAIDHNDDKALLTWFKDELAFLRNRKMMRVHRIKNNYARYKAIQYQHQRYQNRDLPEKRARYMPQFVAPMIKDAVDEKTARLLEYKPTVQIIPQSDEEMDKVDAKIAKRFLGHIERQDKLDQKIYKTVKNGYIAGQSWLATLWNPDSGPKHPMGAKLQGSLKTPFIGEMDNRFYSDLDVYFEATNRFEDVNWLTLIDYEYTEALKKKYPDKALSIHADQRSIYYDFETMEERTLGNRTVKYTFFHRVTEFMPDGFEMCICNDTILKKGPLSYEHGKIPVSRFTDVDNPEEANAESFIETTKSYVSQFNNLTNNIIKNQMLAAYPKWFVQEGSVDDQQLGNDIGIVKVKRGAEAPKLAAVNPTPPEVFAFRDKLKEEYYYFSKSNSIVRGEPPPGVTAFVALQFVSEQESRRQNQDVVKYNDFVKSVYELNLKTAAQFYKKEDRRTMLILSKDNRWSSQMYDPESLKKDYAIVMQNSTALPESKSLRTQLIMDLGKQFPDLFPREQILEMMDLGQSDKFFDEGSAAARAAEAENEMILDGKDIPDPQAHEFHIVHWRVHTSAIQDIGFKTKSIPEVQRAMIDHIMATEMLMFEQIKKSQSFAQLVNQLCPQFPMYFMPPLPTEMLPPEPSIEPQMQDGSAPMIPIDQVPVTPEPTGSEQVQPATPVEPPSSIPPELQ